MSTNVLSSPTLADWTELFADFERHLDRWLVQAVERQPEPTPQPVEPISAPMFAERLQHLQSYLDRAEENAEQALAPLTIEIQSLRQWLETLNTTRVTLAERTVSGV